MRAPRTACFAFAFAAAVAGKPEEEALRRMQESKRQVTEYFLRSARVITDRADVEIRSVASWENVRSQRLAEFREMYYRDDNLRAGDIHKLITLDTPHAGSELADWLVEDNGAATIRGDAAALALQECIICGAVSDLRTTSAIVQNMPAAPPPAHAIVGVGGGPALNDLGGFAAAAREVGGSTARLALAAGAGADWIVRRIFSGRNDMIVSESSQRGGLPDDAVTIFEYKLPLGMALHTTVTSEGRISDEVARLLNQPVGSTAFSHFEKRAGDCC
jgi:hypothetical protein